MHYKSLNGGIINMQNMNELIPIPDYPNYKINRKGYVWSDHYGGNFLKPTVHRSGYVHVYLRNREGKRRTVQVHRAVALTFLPNPHNLPQVHHLNATRDDNNVYNLAWCSAEDNMKERHTRNRRKRNEQKRTLRTSN